MCEGRGYGSANGEKGGSSSRERPPYESGRGSRRRGMYFMVKLKLQVIGKDIALKAEAVKTVACYKQ